jgi:hypothetical protein
LDRPNRALPLNGPKGDPIKVKIALQLRAKSGMTLEWIATRLEMGTRSHLNDL